MFSMTDRHVWALLAVLLFTRSLAFEDTSTTKCPSVCQCRRHHKIAICGKYNPGLTSIPAVPSYIKTFVLLNARIPIVNRSVLLPISNCVLHALKLPRDGITVLSEDTFTDFQDLEKLDLSGNIIPVPLLRMAFRSVGKHLDTIVLSNMSLNNVNEDLFEDTNVQNVSAFIYRQNNVSFLNESVFANMPSLSVLDVSYNHIQNISNWQTMNISILNIGYNWLEKVPDFCWPNGSTRYNRLENLNVENNIIWTISKSSFSCLDNLKKLTLNGNRMGLIPNNAFSTLPRLDILNLNSLAQLKTIDRFAFNSTLLRLQLLKNPKITQELFRNGIPFRFATKLKELILQETRILLPLDSLRTMLLQLKSIEYLNLQRTQINTIPPKTLSNLPFLRRLDLQGNYLASWDSETFSNVTHLAYLNLDGNRISIINETSFPFEMRSRLKQINLGNNDFLCTCTLLWFRTWMTQTMKNKTVVFVNYPQRYYCKNPTHIRLDKYNPTPESCKTLSPYVIPVTAAGSIVVVAVVVMAVVYRNCWNIRYCFYSRRRRQYQQLPGRDVNTKYDAFVSCDSNDIDWALEEVCTFLEDELGRRLCIHERDFEGAKMIIDNIMDCMEESEKIILIISNNFARSKWCQCELKIAIDEHLESDKQIIVIIREPVYRKHMTRPLKALFDTTTYIQWEEDVSAREMFRSRLADLMGCENTDGNEARA